MSAGGQPAALPTLSDVAQRHEALAAQGRGDFSLRMHRALSWLQRAEAAGDDDDVGFVCLWIAFNAAYARELPGYTEKATFQDFMQQVCQQDGRKLLYGLVWRQFSGPICSLLNNQFVFQPFWDALNHGGDEAEWRGAFDSAKQAANKALAEQDTARVLMTVFQRLYTLRNQLMHGGATWRSSVNRAQVRDGRAMLAHVLPVVLWVMMDAPECFAAPPFYPVVGDDGARKRPV